MEEDDFLAGLLRRVAAGERNALRAVYEREAGRLYGIANAILRDRDAASDALQDAFLKIGERAGQYDPTLGMAGAWLAATVRHAALDLARRRGREVLVDDDSLGDTPTEAGTMAALTAAAGGSALRDSLAALEETERAGIVLAFVHGLSHAQVAARFDLPPGTVKSWIRRALLAQGVSAETAPEEDREALAGEYVLGTLDARSAAAAEREMASDPALQTAVASWEARLAPLARLAPPEAPPSRLWARIEAALPDAPPPPRDEVELRQGIPRWWRVLAVASTAATFGLLALVLLPPPEVTVPQRLLGVLLTQRDQPAWLVEAERGGAISLSALNAQPVPSDKVLQLWALPQGASAPTSLGLIPPQGHATLAPGAVKPEPGMTVEISLEPTGGSQAGRPTGPVLFVGRLAAR